jgi:hypothetical protein
VGDYDQPDRGAKFTPRDHPEWIGKLFLFWPEDVETVNFSRPDGTMDPTDMVIADVAIIDLNDPQTGKPVFLQGARIGGSALAPQLKKKVGKKVLGRLKQLPAQGQKSGAYVLEDWQPQDAQLAERYEATFPRAQYAAPSGQEAAQNNGWGQNPPQAPPAAPAPAQGGWGAPPPAAPAPQWGAPAAPPQPPADPFPNAPGLADFLRSRGVDITGMDEGTARQIAATQPQG